MLASHFLKPSPQPLNRPLVFFKPPPCLTSLGGMILNVSDFHAWSCMRFLLCFDGCLIASPLCCSADCEHARRRGSETSTWKSYSHILCLKYVVINILPNGSFCELRVVNRIHISVVVSVGGSSWAAPLRRYLCMADGRGEM